MKGERKLAVNGLAHVAIQAKELEKTIAFYQQVLGFRVGHHWELPSFKIKKAYMLISPDQRTCIEVFDPHAEVPAQGKKATSEEEVTHGALLHFAFYVDDVDSIYQKALDHGATACVQPDQLQVGEPPLTVYNALVNGLNGEVIEFIQDGVNFDQSDVINRRS